MQSDGCIKCPNCGETVGIIQYGEGYVGICCGLIVYNEDEEPEADKRPIIEKTGKVTKASSL
jgi:hypothetical protein